MDVRKSGLPHAVLQLLQISFWKSSLWLLQPDFQKFIYMSYITFLFSTPRHSFKIKSSQSVTHNDVPYAWRGPRSYFLSKKSPPHTHTKHFPNFSLSCDHCKYENLWSHSWKLRKHFLLLEKLSTTKEG